MAKAGKQQNPRSTLVWLNPIIANRPNGHRLNYRLNQCDCEASEIIVLWDPILSVQYANTKSNVFGDEDGDEDSPSTRIEIRSLEHVHQLICKLNNIMRCLF